MNIKEKTSTSEGTKPYPKDNKSLIHYLPCNERYEIEKQMRKNCPPSSHAIKVETSGKTEMISYADWRGQALALSHARSDDAAMLSGYMGNSDIFDLAIAEFSFAYADQNEKDHDASLKKSF